MRVRPSKQALECHVNAERCRRSALAASDRATRDAFLVMEQRWMHLARCYDTPSNCGTEAPSRGVPGLARAEPGFRISRDEPLQ